MQLEKNVRSGSGPARLDLRACLGERKIPSAANNSALLLSTFHLFRRLNLRIVLPGSQPAGKAPTQSFDNRKG